MTDFLADDDAEQSLDPAPVIDSVTAAAEHGSRLDEMIQMRRVIARALDSDATSPRDLAALSRRQLEISREIDALMRAEREEAEEGAVSEDEEWDPDEI